MRLFWCLLFAALAFAVFSPDIIKATPSPEKRKDKRSNEPAAPIVKLPLNAALILTPDFCATKWTTGNGWTSAKDSYAVGQAACEYLEPTLKDAFSTVTTLQAPRPEAEVAVVLQPKIVNADATKGGKREMVVLLEWTATDAAGKTVWVQTVQGTASHKRGGAFSYKKNFKLLLADAVKDAAEESAREISLAPELKALAGDHAAAEVSK